MEIKTPDLGVDKAEVIEILVQVGDHIKKDQSIMLVESSKASVEIPSPTAGVVAEILVELGAVVSEDVLLLRLHDAEGATASTPDSTLTLSAASTATPSEPSAAVAEQSATPASTISKSPVVSTAQQAEQDYPVPDLGVDQAEVSELLVKVGDTVQAGDAIVLVESSKASVEIPSPASGQVTAFLVQQGQTIHTNDPLVRIQSTVSASDSAPSNDSKPSTAKPALSKPPELPSTAPPAIQTETHPVAAQQPESTVASDHTTLVYAGPAVRRAARQLGVDLHEVQASGQHGRIVKDDVYAHVKQRLSQSVRQTTPVAATPSVGLPPLPNIDKWGALHTEPLTRLQQAAVSQLSLNNYIPQVTQFDQADITELEALRQQLKDDYKKSGISLTILAFMVKAVAYLLREETRFNSHLADDQKSLIVRDDIHVGIAVATPDGLIVPVLRHPDQKGIRQIAEELQQLGQKARDKKLSPADLSGAGFTISSLGNLGGTGFTPLVNWPQVAILGVSPAAMQPIWDGAKFVPRLMLPLSLSYDHRVINGADAARFAHRLAALLADLRRILL
ncbi:MAG: 2-oxo acid dehydrogenase subunit E2 [Pseudomonadota bacterium]|nr:2-oxo acid dehydrogenase subunit E2 [Pseudomonadota bacterium]